MNCHLALGNNVLVDLFVVSFDNIPLEPNNNPFHQIEDKNKVYSYFQIGILEPACTSSSYFY